MSTIEEFLNKNSHVRVGVIGDAMVDEYYQVSVKRLSPEFPIPVMLSGSEAATAVLGTISAALPSDLKVGMSALSADTSSVSSPGCRFASAVTP